jgi:hypothetical protein
MEHHDEEFEATPDEPSAAKLSLVGGFLGTVSGLKRGGPGGAVLGGLVGGTTGYLTGAALDERSPSQYTDPSDGPLEISVATKPTTTPRAQRRRTTRPRTATDLKKQRPGRTTPAKRRMRRRAGTARTRTAGTTRTETTRATRTRSDALVPVARPALGRERVG